METVYKDSCIKIKRNEKSRKRKTYLTNETVEKMALMWLEGTKTARIASKFDVSVATASRVILTLRKAGMAREIKPKHKLEVIRWKSIARKLNRATKAL